MKLLKYFSLAFLLSLASCSTVASCFHYSKGADCFIREEYDQAVEELNKAVELEPRLARHHVMLCAAHMHLGNYQLAWEHSRKSRLCTYGDELSACQFQHMCDGYVHERGVDKPGTRYAVVLEALGTPDLDVLDKGDLRTVIYGTLVMKFEKDKLVNSYIIPFP